MGVALAGLVPFAIWRSPSPAWWQWAFPAVLAARLLYTGLSEKAGERAHFLRAHYRETAVGLHGKWYPLKTNLPLLFTAVFLTAALLLRLIWQIFLPVGIYVVFVVLLAVSAAYSIGIDRSIIQDIDAQYAQQKEA